MLLSDDLRLWFLFTARGKICSTCHKISYTIFFVVYPTLPLSARGFPAHQQPTKWFSCYISHDNLTSCNGFTRHWCTAVPVNCTATCCAARNKCLCNSPNFSGLQLTLLVWNTNGWGKTKPQHWQCCLRAVTHFWESVRMCTKHGKKKTSLDQSACDLGVPALGPFIPSWEINRLTYLELLVIIKRKGWKKKWNRDMNISEI